MDVPLENRATLEGLAAGDQVATLASAPVGEGAWGAGTSLGQNELDVAQGIEEMIDAAEVEVVDDGLGVDNGDDQAKPNDTACLSCDDGGNLIACDGDCMRSFCIGRDCEGVFREDHCNPLGMPEDLGIIVEESHEDFYCPSCQTHTAKCFSCKKEGPRYGQKERGGLVGTSSSSYDPNILLRCGDYLCGRYYHLSCIGIKVGPAEGPPHYFTCPLHRCAGADCDLTEGEIIGCRRCPVAYHEECLPLALSTTCHQHFGKRVWIAGIDEAGERKVDANGVPVGDEVERSLIYCMKHPMGPQDQVPPHEAALFSPATISSWRSHYAKLYPQLESSKQYAASHPQVASPKSARKAAHLEAGPMSPASKQATPGQAAVAGSPVAVATSGEKRRRLQKAAPEVTEEQGTGVRFPPTAAPMVPPRPMAKGVTAIGPDPTHLPLQAFVPGAFDQRPAQPPGPKPALPSSICTSQNLEDAQEDEEEYMVGGDEQLDTLETSAAEQEEGAGAATNGAGDGDEEDGFDPFEGLPVYDFMLPEYWTVEARAARLDEMAARHYAQHTVETERAKTRMPEPYDQNYRKTISEERLKALTSQVRQAIKDKAMARLPSHIMREVDREADILRTSLASYLHTDRYSSYGRHFTKTNLLQHTADRLEVFTCIRGDVLIDFSCGANEFLPIFKETCLKKGKVVEGRAFDIITPPILEDFEEKSWFDVKPEDIGVPGERLIIGLNPPYGMNNVLAQKFQDHALKFRPRIIVLIVPPSTTIPSSYKVLLEDRHTMADKSFYIPGLAEENKAQWNKVAPSLRILARHDLYPLRDYLVMPGLPPPSRGYVFKPERFVQHPQMQHPQMQHPQMQPPLQLQAPHMQPMGMGMGGMPMGPAGPWQGRMPY